MTQKLICKTYPSYTIEIQRGILKQTQKLVDHLRSLGQQFVIITDDIVSTLYGNQLLQNLSAQSLSVSLISFPHGEQQKTRATKEQLENQMFEKGLGRDTCVIALGGGVVTDLGGYLAATYCRGIPLILIPTSLLGMVDACLGGKTGANVPYGKNLVGCIYQPCQVWIDPETVLTLPFRELKNGCVEMIKHGLIKSLSYFEFLEKEVDNLLNLDLSTVETAIFESCAIKKAIVEQDERESSERRLLNFGHTIGHALEQASNYTLSHGEAVAIGILVESYLAMQRKWLSISSFQRIQNILEKYQLSLQLPADLDISTVLQTMKLDKKSSRGQPRFVMISEIGTALNNGSSYCVPLEEEEVIEALRWMFKDFIINKNLLITSP